MSHLPLDARAILEYLNELGYRNISAEQLKEFLKGMQPQSEISKSKPKTKNCSNPSTQQQLPATTISATPATTTTKPEPPQQRTPVKVIKCKKPLCHFKFYLDIRDHQLTKKIEDQIKVLGGSLEFFLTPSVTHFITDKTVQPPTVGNNNNSINSRPTTPQTPATPGTPQTPYSLESYDGGKQLQNGIATTTATPTTTPGGSRKTRQSRADAILNRARRQSTTTNVVTATTAAIGQDLATPAAAAAAPVALKIDSSITQPYTVWQTEYSLRFFKKVQHELKQYLESSSHDRKLNNKSYTVEPIHLKGGFIKIEALKRNYRPYYQLFKKPSEWPKIELTRDDGAFRLSPKKTPEEAAAAAAAIEDEQQLKQKMTRKSRSRSSQRQHPLPSAVQALKKDDTGAKTSAGPQRNSALGGGAGACKQIKESSDKQCGVCEICKIEYDTLTIHLKTKDHEYFAKNSQNFIALDTLIHASADVNKFLDENKKMSLKPELEEMELAEDLIIDEDAADPLEDAAPLSHEDKRRSSGAHKTPSPSLREKSKRTTKGKHSSEKFQKSSSAKLSAKSATKTPVRPTATTTSPQKKPSSSMLELQRIEAATTTTTINMTTPSTRKKPSAASAISPPIRAMLPASSMYKVVETQEFCSPARKPRDALGDEHQAVASPSLIVKFKKVRSTELHILNGEAENFMFPKQRTSSELPTDVDRHTTSDRVRGASVSSASLDSTSELMDVENEREQQQLSQLSAKSTTGKKAIATAKRRKGGRPPKSSKQSFPIAPIQPEVQLKRLRKPTTAAALVAATASITLPEATRKSSRTATAIVTAATTSSRLLRAAVEAAKNNSRLMATKAAPIVSRRMTTVTRPIEEVSVKRETMRRRMSVVKMEDRMGDYKESNTEESDDNEAEVEEEEVDEVLMENDEQDDESDDEQDDDGDDDDDDNDKDYVGGSFLKQRPLPAATSSTRLNASTREQRAAKRQCFKSEMMEEDDTEEEEEEELVEQEKKEDVDEEEPELKTTPQKRKQAKPRAAKPKKNTPPQQQPHLQDYSNSDRFHELCYAFERVPAADLWYRVFSRQDACEERYYEYFGSTKYRKLPYELGPIPFDRTLDGICCKLCKTGNTNKTSNKPETGLKAKRESETCNDVIKQEEDTPNTLNGAASPTLSGNTASSSQYTHKHKKLHLLQRYRQEQHDLLQKQQQIQQKEDQLVSLATALGSTLKCDSKASTPERGRVTEHLLERDRERAESTHSNASSYASSTATMTKKQYRNKHLNKAAFLNLELPPRKSPREHASTLALVSCIIKQRQDSQSKSNSDMDEPPPTTPTTPTPTIKEETKPTPIPIPATVEVPAVRSPRNTRSAAATPVEELRFATEISENVKRLRRGQNKYDHSPPIVPNARGHGSRGRGTAKSPLGRRLHHPQHRSQTPKNVKRRRRQMPAALHHSTNNKYHSYGGSGIGGINSQGTLASIRKTGSKKGVLEFDMDAAALKALDAATKHTNVRQLEWEIDKFMQLAGKDYDLDVDLNLDLVDATELVQPPAAMVTLQTSAAKQAPPSRMDTEPPAMPPATTAPDWNTPPPTDYFSSDFDLYDLFANAKAAGNSEDDQLDRKRKGFSLYNSVALHNYFRKRKNLKSNKTGWPKVQKKKSSARQQQMLHQKICFLQSIGEANGGQAANPAELLAAEAKDSADQKPRRDSTVITPPDSEVDECDGEDAKTNVNDDGEEEEVDDDDSQLDAFESIPDEEGDDEAETMADDSNNEEEEEDAAASQADVDAAADADEEEEDEGDAYEDDDYDNVVPAHKHSLRSTAASPAEKFQSNFLQVPGITATTTATSTPSTQMLRCGLRRTPQLNGSLGSCISPSEKAGDNSDIFTVSSDGLDTDMDMSNSHSQLNNKTGDDDHHEQPQHHCPNHTPKRKFDLAKYASNNSASSTCAAEAATAAVKSLAISQFLKKEVRVTCRRLRAPFRRFRYRR